MAWHAQHGWPGGAVEMVAQQREARGLRVVRYPKPRRT